MKNNSFIALVSILCFWPLIMSGAEEQPSAEKADKVLIQTNDGYRFRMNRAVASLSNVIDGRLEDFPTTKIIPLPKINSKSFKNIQSLMEFAYSVAKAPLKDQILKIGAQIKDQLFGKGLKVWEKLLHNIDYLDIPILKRPLANRMIEYIYTQQQGNQEKIEQLVRDLKIPDEWKKLLAKYWYLNYGAHKNYILPKLDYGFSIDELLAYNKLPKIDADKKINLSDLRINDLTGLATIPDIASTKVLFLNNNRLATFPEHIFKELNQLTELYLENNKFEILTGNNFSFLNQLDLLELNENTLAKLADDSFNGLNKLTVLRLDKNNLEKLPENIFTKLNNLSVINLSNNNISLLPTNIFAGLNNVEHLGLENNQLAELDDKIFDGLSNMTHIFLAHNMLEKLPPTIFKNNHQLTYIDLANNIIQSLSEETFAHLPDFFILHLQNNRLSEQTKNAIKNLALSKNAMKLDL